MAIGMVGTIHGLAPVHAAGAAPVVVSAPAPQATALGTAASLVYARVR